VNEFRRLAAQRQPLPLRKRVLCGTRASLHGYWAHETRTSVGYFVPSLSPSPSSTTPLSLSSSASATLPAISSARPASYPICLSHSARPPALPSFSLPPALACTAKDPLPFPLTVHPCSLPQVIRPLYLVQSAMCGGSILSGFIRPSGAAAGAKKKQQSRRVTADVLWPGLDRKAGEDDFEADFREFERSLSEDDVDAAAGDEDDEVLPPAPEWFIFGGTAKAAPVVSRSTVGENRIKAATFLPPSLPAGRALYLER
jgi:hypothetical protein